MKKLLVSLFCVATVSGTITAGWFDWVPAIGVGATLKRFLGGAERAGAQSTIRSYGSHLPEPGSERDARAYFHLAKFKKDRKNMDFWEPSEEAFVSSSPKPTDGEINPEVPSHNVDIVEAVQDNGQNQENQEPISTVQGEEIRREEVQPPVSPESNQHEQQQDNSLGNSVINNGSVHDDAEDFVFINTNDETDLLAEFVIVPRNEELRSQRCVDGNEIDEKLQTIPFKKLNSGNGRYQMFVRENSPGNELVSLWNETYLNQKNNFSLGLATLRAWQQTNSANGRVGDSMKNMLAGSYKIHLMPTDAEMGQAIGVLFNLLQEKNVQDTVLGFKFLMWKNDTMWRVTAQQDSSTILPRIVVYAAFGFGQQLLNHLYSRFQSTNITGANVCPRFNVKVTDLIYVLQGNGDERDNLKRKKPELLLKYFDVNANYAYYNANVIPHRDGKTSHYLTHPETNAPLTK